MTHASPPPPETPDPVLVNLLTRMHISDPEIVATVLANNGFTRPLPVPTIGALAALPNDAVLRDGDGRGWTAGSITTDDFEDHGPWLLVDTPG